MSKATVLPTTTGQIRTLLLIQSGCYYSYGGKKTKKWFSQTYVPRFNWVCEKPRPCDTNTDLTRSNELLIEKQRLEAVHQPSSPLISQEDFPRNEWNKLKKVTMRTGLIGLKIGVVPQWTITGKKVLCTMLQILDNQVIDYKSPEQFSNMVSARPQWKEKKYAFCVVGAVNASPLEFTEKYNSLFERHGCQPKRKLTRFIITEDAAVAPGTPLFAEHFRVGDFVDVSSRTIEMGFQGVLTRWGMKGGRASHGVTKSHRRMGSVGGGGDKGGIWKGKKMPGHMGSLYRYHRGLEIMRINTKYNVIYVRGPNIPGPPRSYVRIMDTFVTGKRVLLKNNPPPMPTVYEDELVEEEDLYHPELFRYDTSPYVSYEGVDPDSLHLHAKQYLLTGGTVDGKNHTYRRKIKASR